LYQEVSSQEPNTTSTISSPLILNRSVTTQLAIQDGMTAVIGGLIQDNYTREQRGVPGLKDIPFVGTAFRRDAVSGSKVELVILVTPYVIRDSEDMSKLATSYSDTVNRSLSNRGPHVYTLYPWRTPFQAKRDHVLRPNAVRGAPAPGAELPTSSGPAGSATPPTPAATSKSVDTGLTLAPRAPGDTAPAADTSAGTAPAAVSAAPRASATTGPIMMGPPAS